jgi:hypothetical protein
MVCLLISCSLQGRLQIQEQLYELHVQELAYRGGCLLGLLVATEQYLLSRSREHQAMHYPKAGERNQPGPRTHLPQVMQLVLVVADLKVGDGPCTAALDGGDVIRQGRLLLAVKATQVHLRGGEGGGQTCMGCVR